jgi:phospholipid-binding lipoprotein MlaA
VSCCRFAWLPVALASSGLALGGCASQGVDIRSLPDETPAADNAAAAENAAALRAALAAATPPDSGNSAGENEAPPLTPAEAPPLATYDPWERVNRFTYRFNARFDETVFLPVANGYRRLPAPLRSGVHNFFDNLAQVGDVVNYALQWRLHRGVRSLGRFVINSSLGVGGLLDVAKKLRLPDASTGFSDTLGRWGLHPGPFLVIPVLGPSTLRDGIGALGDYGISYGINLAGLYRGTASWILGVSDAIDERANVDFRYYASGSPFEYEAIRFLYVRKRLIEDAALHRQPPKRDAERPAGE